MAVALTQPASPRAETATRRLPLPDAFRLAGVGLMAIVALVAATVLVGWATGQANLKSVFPGSGFMHANAAVALLLSAGAALVYQRATWSSWRDPLLRSLAGTSALIAALTLVEAAGGWNLHIDQLVFTDNSPFPANAPGRMALSTAVSLIFLNTALLIADSPRRFGIAQILTGGAMFLSMLASVGALFGVDVFTGLATYTAMAVHTSVCLMLLCVGFFFGRPSDGLMQIVSDSAPSGFIVRRLLLPVFVVPVLLAWLSRQGELAGYYTAEFSMTFFAVSAITALSMIVWTGGTMLRGLERRRESAERQRYQSEERLRLAVTEAPVPMVIHDENDRILHMSRGWTEYSGFSTADTPTISSWTSRAQGQTKTDVEAYLRQLASARQTVYGGEATIRTKPGESRVWDFSTTPLSRQGTEGRTYLTIAVDVTDRKRAEGDLRRMNEELEQRIADRTRDITQANDVLWRQSEQLKEQAALLDLASEGIIVRDLYGTIVYWSAGAADLYGWTREQALGQVSHTLLRAVYPRPVADLEKEVVASGHWEGELVHTTRDGQQIAVESRWTLTRNERGVPQGFLELNRNITARKRADAMLRDSESRFRAVSETANEGIVTADDHGVIRYWNPGAERMFQRPETQALGQPLTIMVTEAGRATWLARLRDDLASAKHREVGHAIEGVGLRGDGTEFPVEVSVASFQTSKGVFLSMILRDITARKEAERALKSSNQDLARSNQELEQFAYVASHDLQEPLRMVANYTKLLGSRYRDKLDADAQEFIDFAVDGSLRMQALIRDLLEFARVGTRGKEFKSTPAEKVVKEAVVNLSGAIEESGADVRIGPMPTIIGDASQLTQVFQNLMGNALKFRRKDAALVISVTATRTGDAWTFAVADNGIGIDPKYFERIFQMFQRLHGRGEYEGTGIGLALVKKIVERHGGRITVASQPGQGTTFSFTLPDAGPVKPKGAS